MSTLERRLTHWRYRLTATVNGVAVVAWFGGYSRDEARRNAASTWRVPVGDVTETKYAAEEVEFL